MIRSGSMLVAEAAQRSFFGENFVNDSRYMKYCPKQVWLASLFNDEMVKNTRHLHPFSVQHLMQLGVEFGKDEGEWFAPGTIAQVYKKIFDEYCEEQFNMSIYICPPGLNTLYVVCNLFF